MVGPYRLKTFDLRLPAGPVLLPPDALDPVAAAGRLLAEAEDRAARIVADAEAEREAERRRGYEEGRTAADLAAVERLASESLVLDAALARAERELVEVVVSAVRKIVDGFDDAAKAEAVVRAGLRQMRRERRAELTVSPALAEHFRVRMAEIVAGFPDLDHVDVSESEALQGAAIVLETAIGRVESDFAGCLDEVEAALRRGFALPPAESRGAP